ncbi:MAG: N-acyl homoserine lactonase family protein [Proteobacteria bacterium]|nr:N-acyl homoserine lactonase family protein [Pseudomonadota bacterium]
MTTYAIHPIVMGSKEFDRTYMTHQYGYGQTMIIPIYSWYLDGGNKKILVDTGERSPLRSDARQQALGAKISTFEEGLAVWSLTPEDIDIVIHTHLHRDHIENDDKCVNARFYIHENEWRLVEDPHPLDYRYEESFLWGIEERGQIEFVGEDMEIAPGIKVIHSPAHTEGGMSVLVETEQGTAVITGFCTILENFSPPPMAKGQGLEVIPPGTHTNAKQSYDTVLKIKNMAEILLPLHEPKFAGMETIP